MEAGRGRGEEGEVVVVGRAAHEGDDLLRAVRQLEPEHARVEVDLAGDVRGEEEDVAQAPRGRLEAALGSAAHGLARRIAGAVERRGGAGGAPGAGSSRTVTRLPSGSRDQKPPPGAPRGGADSRPPPRRPAPPRPAEA